MCGIAGIIKFEYSKPLEPERLQAMCDALARRGPDGAGIYVDGRAGKAAGLVHRRLAILDRPGGRQPMANEDGNVHVVFNGEIYNHVALRKELTAAGHRFASDHSDTEVLVHGWEEWGVGLPEKLVGMFGFAVWDEKAETLFLARDRMGQKPLFYATLEDGIVFGSTVPSVLAWPEVPRRVPRELMGLYLLLGYVPPPGTIFRDVSQVVPGGWLRLRRDVLDGGKYWDGAAGKRAKDERQETKSRTGAELRGLLGAAVESQLMADVPVACFLSGGIDSSIIAALMQKAVLARGGAAIHTVSAGFAESGFDETHFAAAVAKKIGSRHTRLEVAGTQRPMETLEMLMRVSLGQPFADSSILPTYHLSKAVREIAPVALSGDGVDELFGGYDRYRAMQLLSRWSGAARLMPRSSPIGSLSKRERYRRLVAAGREGDLSERYTRLVEIFPLAMVEELIGDEVDDFAPSAAELGLGEPTALRLAMMRDQREYLPGDVLWKVDSASMAEALEVRSPFLDHRVVELANSLEESELIADGRGKAILRREFAEELPAEVRERGKKGFAAPVGEWLKGEMRAGLHDLVLGGNSFVAGTLSRAAIERLVREHETGARDHALRLFSLLMMEIWAREFKPAVE
ncbi:MAG TPA: asparagine synthase (glutamine-hydrolyzing) [Phycisphaerae bacterium]|jgi:asparagine synthase (glutamine-hydrolysing)